MVVVRYENGQHRDERDPSFKLRIVCVSVNVHLNSSHRQLLHKHLGLVGRLSHGRDKEATPSEIVFFLFLFIFSIFNVRFVIACCSISLYRNCTGKFIYLYISLIDFLKLIFHL